MSEEEKTAPALAEEELYSPEEPTVEEEEEKEKEGAEEERIRSADNHVFNIYAHYSPIYISRLTPWHS